VEDEELLELPVLLVLLVPLEAVEEDVVVVVDEEELNDVVDVDVDVDELDDDELEVAIEDVSWDDELCCDSDDDCDELEPDT